LISQKPHLSLVPVNLPLGQELSAKPFSLLSTNPRFLRTVVLKEDLPAMKDTAGRAGGLFMGQIILTGISQGKHKFRLEYPVVEGKTICMAICACGFEVEILYFENYGGVKYLQSQWNKHIAKK
jgi:hypothetical protein